MEGTLVAGKTASLKLQMWSTSPTLYNLERCFKNERRVLRALKLQACRKRGRQFKFDTVAEVGVVYATSTGNTRQVAWLIKQCLGIENDPVDAATISPRDLTRYEDGLIIGAPTWATAREDMRTGTAMDDVLWQIRTEFNSDFLAGIPFAVFGCGDSLLWPENFADGIDEVYTTLLQVGGNPAGQWVTSASGEFQAVQSKAYREDGYFVGLPIDNVNESGDTCAKVQRWCNQLRSEWDLDIPEGVLRPSLEEVPDVLVPPEQPFLTADWTLHDKQEYSLFGRRLGGGWYQVGGGSSAAGRWIKFTDDFLLMRAGLRGQPEYQIEYRYIESLEIQEPQAGVHANSSELVTMIMRLKQSRLSPAASSSVGLWGSIVVLMDMQRDEFDGICSFLRSRGAALSEA